MKKSNLIKGILVAMVLVSLIAVLKTNSYADDTIQLTNTAASNTLTSSNTLTTNSTTNTAVPSTITTSTNTASTTNTLSNLPKTGLADSTIAYIALGVAVVAAIYGFKKVRDYRGI